MGYGGLKSLSVPFHSFRECQALEVLAGIDPDGQRLRYYARPIVLKSG